MKVKPKILLSMLLSLCMVLSLVPLAAFADTVELPSGVNSERSYNHTYHTKVETTANVSVKGANGNVIETMQVNKSGEFVEGNVSDTAVQAEIQKIDDEINAQFSSRGTLGVENRTTSLKFDHFDSNTFYSFIPASGDTVDFGTDTEAMKQYFVEHQDAVGTFNIFHDLHEYQVHQITYDLIVQENSQPAANGTITSAAVENVKLDYENGDAPKAAARRAGVNMDKFDILYESWEKREKTDEFTTETVAYWYSDESWYQEGEERLTAFDKDGQYQYSVRLKAQDGYTFSDSISADDITLNGKSLPEGSYVIVLDEGRSCIVIYGMTLRTVRPLESVTLNGVSTEFYVDGDKPRFNGYSGSAFSDVAYEKWEDKDDRSVGINSDESLNGGYSQLIESFKHGKTYTYGVAFHIADLGLEQGYRFDENTKLYLHGEEVPLKPEQVQVTDGGMTIRFTDVFSMTPEAGGAAPSEKFTITYTDGVDGEEIFPDQSYTAEAGQPTPAFSGTPTRTGYTFAGWDREIPGTMPAENLTIRATWEKVPAPSIHFTDIAPGAYYEKAVAWAVDSGITNGTSDTTFSPNDACNRGQIVTFLWRMAGKPKAQERNNPFTDVKEGTFCYEAVLWAAEQGITTGKTATTFCPAETCNRGQIVTFLWRYAGKPAPQNQTKRFNDVAAGSFCDQAVLWAVENRITFGKTATTFDPTGKCTRAQAVTFLYRGRELLKDRVFD